MSYFRRILLFFSLRQRSRFAFQWSNVSMVSCKFMWNPVSDDFVSMVSNNDRTNVFLRVTLEINLRFYVLKSSATNTAAYQALKAKRNFTK